MPQAILLLDWIKTSAGLAADKIQKHLFKTRATSIFFSPGQRFFNVHTRTVYKSSPFESTQARQRLLCCSINWSACAAEIKTWAWKKLVASNAWPTQNHCLVYRKLRIKINKKVQIPALAEEVVKRWDGIDCGVLAIAAHGPGIV